MQFRPREALIHAMRFTFSVIKWEPRNDRVQIILNTFSLYYLSYSNLA